jgi:hypothetical protein
MKKLLIFGLLILSGCSHPGFSRNGKMPQIVSGPPGWTQQTFGTDDFSCESDTLAIAGQWTFFDEQKHYDRCMASKGWNAH